MPGAPHDEPSALRATGFWRLASPAETGGARTWLVAPDGRCTFLLGVNTVMRNTLHAGTPRCAGITTYIGRHDDPLRAAREEWGRLSGADGAPKPYYFNSVGAFSEENDFDHTGGDSYMVRPPPHGAGAPYAVVLDVTPRGKDAAQMALADAHGNPLTGGFSRSLIGDPFNHCYLETLDTLAKQTVAPRADDPGLQMWFAGNELGIFDVSGHPPKGPPKLEAGVRDLRHWIWARGPDGSSLDTPLCARHALGAFLIERYRNAIDALNSAWHSRFDTWEAVVDSAPFGRGYSAACGEDLQRFVHDRLLPAWVRAITTRVRAADPHHLLASPRLAIASPNEYRFWRAVEHDGLGPDHWADAPHGPIPADTGDVHYCPFDALGGDGGFDLVAVNAYCGDPKFPDPWFSGGLAKLHDEAKLPVVISEFGIRARIASWNNRGGAGSFVPTADPAAEQLERGHRYATQIDQFASLPFLVGACWHAWSDRYDSGGDQINMGLVQCTDSHEQMVAGARWEPAYAPIAQTNRTILQAIRDADRKPTA